MVVAVCTLEQRAGKCWLAGEGERKDGAGLARGKTKGAKKGGGRRRLRVGPRRSGNEEDEGG